MQPVLVIDLTRDPILAYIVDVSTNEGLILERATASRLSWLSEYSRKSLEKNKIDSEVVPIDTNGTSLQDNPTTMPFNGGEVLLSLVKQFTREWTNSVVILPPIDYISFGLNAPFGDMKRLSKVLLSEVQDTVPFELDEMHLHYRSMQFLGRDDFFVHVGLIPKQFIRDMLVWLNEATIEATILCPSTCVLSTFYDLSEGASPLAALIHYDYPNMNFGIFIDAKFCVDRTFNYFTDNEGQEHRDHFIESSLRQFRTMLLAFEKRFDRNIPQILVFGKEVNTLLLQDLFPQREIRLYADEEYKVDSDFFAKKAALFGRDEKAPEPLVNFRSGEFKVGIKWAGLFHCIQQVLPYFLTFCVCTVVTLLVSYFARESRLEAIQATTVETIRELIPSIDPNSSSPSEFVKSELATIQKQLRDLGSPFQLSPLDALVELSKDFQKRSNATIRRINIVGNKVTIEGSAPNYAAMDTLEKAFKKKKRTYCQVKNTVNATGASGGSSTLNFSFTLELCE
ncbi:MAG: hypothetical protein GYA55_02285 [SAR324 cluster bacterium]|uniref:GspL cytoplasmic actin-ATPase-like domain-containing protein n=1 Tax=SAR324 cluster bacterium TaxID=2024889 RepID=A0A7X9IJC0_9DELT|nr:hypothetical protein [SAR324 cluster bacterium]